MKNIIISIQPEYCELIAAGKKTIEVRKTAPKAPFRAFIYQTKKKWIYRLLEWLGLYQQKIIGEFICDKVDKISVHNDACYSIGNLFANKLKNMCLTVAELKEYLGAKNNGYAIGITALKIYDKPRELAEFYKPCKNLSRGARNCNNCDYSKFKWYGESTHIICRNTITRPPQSYMYCEPPKDLEDKI